MGYSIKEGNYKRITSGMDYRGYAFCPPPCFANAHVYVRA